MYLPSCLQQLPKGNSLKILLKVRTKLKRESNSSKIVETMFNWKSKQVYAYIKNEGNKNI